MQYSDLNYINTLSEFRAWLQKVEEREGAEFNRETALFNIWYRAGNFDSLRAKLIRNFVRQIREDTGDVRAFLENEQIRSDIALKERGWLTYEEYCEMKRKERE